jgi:porin
MSRRTMPLKLLAATTILSAALSGAAFAADGGSDAYSDKLLGDVGGVRSALAEKGVTMDVDYNGTFWNVGSGGINTGNNYLDNLNVVFDVDGSKAYGLSGNTLHVNFLNNFGGKPNEKRIGSAEGIDNTETGTNTAKLYEFWVQQEFLDSKASALVGLYDLNSEFFYTDMSANFLKPTFETGQELAQSGQNGPSVFPNTSLAARLKYNPTDDTYVQAVILDGVPGDPNRPHGTHIDLRERDGVLTVAEVGYTPDATDDGAFNKFAIGAWQYSKSFDDLVDVDGAGDPRKRASEGIYGLATYRFYEDEATKRALGAFVRGGVGDADTAQVEYSYTAGLVANGWVPSREEAEIGVGISQSINGDKYRQSVVAAGGRADRSETGFEAYYRDVIYRGISIQPDVQYIVNPGSDPALDNAFITGVRLGISF